MPFVSNNLDENHTAGRGTEKMFVIVTWRKQGKWPIWYLTIDLSFPVQVLSRAPHLTIL